jgi:cytoskeletal protein CcmA (bactofilin family)
MRNKFPTVILSSLFVLTLVSGLLFGITKPVQASYFDNDGVIEAGEVIDDDVFMSGNNVVMDGTINGFLMASGQTITINGTVNGDVFLGGSKIFITESAKITGNLFFGCQNAELKGVVEGSVAGGSTSMLAGGDASIGRNLYYGGYSLELQPGIKTGRDLYAGVYQAILGGEISRNAKLGAGAVELTGDVGGDMTVDFGTTDSANSQQPPMFFFPGMNIEMPKPIDPGLRVGPDAKIGGKLTYTASNENLAAVEAKPGGGVVYQTPVPKEVKEGKESVEKPVKVNVITPFVKWALKTFRTLVTLLILGGLAVWLLPGLLKKLVVKVKEKPAPSAGYGFVVIIIAYAAAAFASLIVLLLGILFLVVTLGGLGGTVFTVGFSSIAVIMAVFGFLVSYGSKLVIAYLVGLWVMKLVSPNTEHAGGWAMLIGVVIYTILRSIPLIGWIFGLLATLFGIGSIWLLYREWRSSHQLPAPVPAAPTEG